MGVAAEHLDQATRADIARRCLSEPREHGAEIWAHCPWHVESSPGNAFSYNPGTDLAYCNSCGGRGDLVDVYGGVRGMDKAEAYREFLAEFLPDQLRRKSSYRQTPKMPREQGGQAEYQARQAKDPEARWRGKAERLVSWAAEHLEHSPEKLSWLQGRGIGKAAAVRHGLGWCPGERGKDIYRERPSWGLPVQMNPRTGKEKPLWIPIGLTIPIFRHGRLHRVRIRRFQQDELPKYYWIPGSGDAPMLLRRSGEAQLPDAVVVVEAELDAIMIHEHAGDLVHVISLGTLQGKPSDEKSYRLCKEAAAVLLALDFEAAHGSQLTADSQKEDAGAKTGKALQWWRDRFPQAEYWPAPEGKDPGEAYQAGCDIRCWIKDGLPHIFSVVGGRKSEVGKREE